MERDAVKVRDYLVYRDLGCAVYEFSIELFGADVGEGQTQRSVR